MLPLVNIPLLCFAFVQKTTFCDALSSVVNYHEVQQLALLHEMKCPNVFSVFVADFWSTRFVYSCLYYLEYIRDFVPDYLVALPGVRLAIVDPTPPHSPLPP